MNAEFAVDTSVLVAIMRSESDASTFLDALKGRTRIVARASVLETRIWCLRNLGTRGEVWLDAFFEHPLTEFGDLDATTERLATDAYERFGKGRHPAKLNFGDCLAYAVAKRNGLALLFKGGDFVKTDLAAHPASSTADAGG